MEQGRFCNAESRQQLELITRAPEGVAVCREPSGKDSARVRDTKVGPKLIKFG